jgi:hypothetical protein
MSFVLLDAGFGRLGAVVGAGVGHRSRNKARSRRRDKSAGRKHTSEHNRDSGTLYSPLQRTNNAKGLVKLQSGSRTAN